VREGRERGENIKQKEEKENRFINTPF